MTMITEKEKSELVLRGKTPCGNPENKEGFDSLVEVRAEFIRSKCADRKVTLSEEKRPAPSASSCSRTREETSHPFQEIQPFSSLFSMDGSGVRT